MTTFRMTLPFVTVLSLLAGVPVLAQQGTPESLERILNGMQTEDTATVQILNRLSEMLLRKDPGKARDYAERALRLSTKLTFADGAGRAHMNLGECAYNRGAFPDAQGHYEHALAGFTTAGRQSGIVRALNGIGKARMARYDNDTAMICFRKALAMAEQSKDSAGMANAFYNMALLLPDSAASRHFQRSLQIRRSMNDSIGMAASYWGLGSIHVNRGEPEEAFSNYQRCLTIRERMNDKRGIAYALRSIGNLHWQLGSYHDALACFEKGLKIEEEIGDRSGMAFTVNSIGAVLLVQGDHQGAIERFQQALALQEELHDTKGRADALTNLGTVYARRNDTARAISFFEQAITLRRELNDLPGLSKALNNMGVIQYYQGNEDAALEYYEQCYAIRERLGDKAGLSTLLDNMGLIYEERNDFEKAASCFDRAYILHETLGNRSGLAASLINLGMMEHKQGLHGTAYTTVTRGLDIAKEIGEIEWMKEGYAALMQISVARNDFVNAFEYQRKYGELKDSLINEANTKSINEMEAKFDSERKEKRIALLERDKVLQTSELERKQQALEVQLLETERSRQRALLLAKEKQLVQLDLDNTNLELELRTSALQLQQSENTRKAGDLKRLTETNLLHSKVISGQRVLLTSLFVAAGLLVVIGLLVVKRLRDRKQAESLRAEAAEFQARAVEADSERQQKEAQKVFTKQLITRQEQERKRVSLELHDSISQELIVIRNRALLSKNETSSVEKIHRHIDEIVEMSTQALKDIRQVSRALHPYQLTEIGLTETLRMTLQKIADSSNMAFEIDIDPIDGLLESEGEINLYRIVQECVNNILKHARAQHAEIHVRRTDEAIRLNVSDDGVGFDPQHQTFPALNTGLGMKGLDERVQMLQGTLTIRSEPGQGTRIELSIPLAVDQAVDVDVSMAYGNGETTVI